MLALLTLKNFRIAFVSVFSSIASYDISVQLNTSFNEIQSKKTWYKLYDFTDCVPASPKTKAKKKLYQIMVIETFQKCFYNVWHTFSYFFFFLILFLYYFRSENIHLQNVSMLFLMEHKNGTTFFVFCFLIIS